MASQLDLGLGTTKKRAVSLVISRGDDKQLSKEQKRFNSIVKRIKKVREEMAKDHAAREELQTGHMPRVMEAEKASVLARRALVCAAHACPERQRLSKKESKKLASILLDEVANLLETSTFHDDAELKSLFQAYDPNKASYDKVLQEEEEVEKRMAADLFNSVFGTDLSADDMDDGERLHEHIKKARDDMQAPGSRARKKQGKKQTAAAAAREQAENALHKTTRQIYLDLVKHYHPDREQDETARAEKTEWMKQITAAYEADDHLRLLELQMTLLSERDNAYAGFDDAHLKIFNQTLQRQLRELEMEMHFSHGGPLDEFLHRDPRTMRRRVDAYIADMEADAESSRQLAAAFKEDPSALRRWVRTYDFDDGADFDISRLDIPF